MLDLQEDTYDDGSVPENSKGSRYDLNISRALFLAINDENIDGIDFINIIRCAMGHKTFIKQGGPGKIKYVAADEEEYEDKVVSEDEEIDDILGDLK